MFNWRKPIICGLLYASGSNIPKYLKEIRKVDNLPLKAKEEYQKTKLEKLLLHAHKNVPYYNKVLEKSKVVINGKVNLNNFDNIPILTKEIIRKEGKNLYSKDYKKRNSYENTSGGSTGEPVKFIQNKEYNEWNIASKIYLFKKFGKDEGMPEIKFWGSDRDILKGNLTLKDRCINYLYNRKFFNTYNLSKKEFSELIKINNTFKPKAYWTYVDAMQELSKFIINNNIKVYSPNMIVTTIGPLYPEARKVIEQAFNCQVFNQYGSRELGWVAFENEKELDVCFWRQFVELIGKTNQKDIIVTSLDNYSMPLIRYEIGDVATEGLNYNINKIKSFLTIGNILGRTLGFFKLKNGTLKHTHFIVQQLFFRDWIKKFQIIQKTHTKIQIKVVGTENKREMKEIETLIKKFMGQTFKIDWKFIKEISPSKSGKYIYTVCEVQ